MKKIELNFNCIKKFIQLRKKEKKKLASKISFNNSIRFRISVQ